VGSAVPTESAGVATSAARDERPRRARPRRVTPAPSSRRRFGWSRRRGSSDAPSTGEPVEEPGTSPPRTVAELVAQRARIAAAQQAEIEAWVQRAADDDTAR
jgi:hypothetical protein